MRIPRIFLPQALQVGSEIQLDASSTNHTVRVLRLRAGAPLVVFNGEGGEFRATLTAAERRHATVRLERFLEREAESPLRTTLVQGISKGERMDYAIQKSVELGVSSIVPVITEHCAVQLKNDRAIKRREHWANIVRSACEQCGRNRLPEVVEPLPLAEWLRRPVDGIGLVLAPEAEDTQLSGLAFKSVSLLVGPEGGLSTVEVEAALAAGYLPWRLGPRILRTETAAVAALTTVQVRWGDLA